MLRIGTLVQRNCQGVSRREVLQVGAAGVLGLSLPQALLAEGGEKSCILLWLDGGPSHHETFDPKPDAPGDIRGPYAPIETNVSGIQISSLLPLLARQADRYVLIRSLTHKNPNHTPLPMLSGDPGVDSTYGSVVARFKGHRGAVPPYVEINARFKGLRLDAGRLGAAFNAVPVEDPTIADVAVPDFPLPAQVDSRRFDRRRLLLDRLDAFRSRLDESNAVRALDTSYQRALALLTSPEARQAFDLARETDAARERYGAHTFGQSCLLARRLVEAGTRFVQVRWADGGGFNWDVHGTVLSGLVEMEQRLCPRLDQGLSTLLEDLDQRGLLASTLVVAFGEFGRTPAITKEGGRDHWPHCFTALIAGAGLPGGTVIGSSDAQGGYPATRPVSPQELAATIYRLLGLNANADDRLRPFVRAEPVAELVY